MKNLIIKSYTNNYYTISINTINDLSNEIFYKIKPEQEYVLLYDNQRVNDLILKKIFWDKNMTYLELQLLGRIDIDKEIQKYSLPIIACSNSILDITTFTMINNPKYNENYDNIYKDEYDDTLSDIKKENNNNKILEYANNSKKHYLLKSKRLIVPTYMYNLLVNEPTSEWETNQQKRFKFKEINYFPYPEKIFESGYIEINRIQNNNL